jgi:hypothetical protein
MEDQVGPALRHAEGYLPADTPAGAGNKTPFPFYVCHISTYTAKAIE